MHSQFLTLESELLSLSKNQETRARVRQRYGGFMLATLVTQLEGPSSSSQELFSQIQCASRCAKVILNNKDLLLTVVKSCLS